MKISESFLAGILVALIVGGSALYYHQNHKMKQVVDKNGNTATCQVIRSRFWYEIKNCSNPKMNKQMVWTNDIKDYTIQ
jgi:hypothetical protein